MMIGKVISNWTIVSQISFNKFEVKCKCGSRAKKYLSQMGKGKSEGCFTCSFGRRKHGMSYHVSYNTWKSLMKNLVDPRMPMHAEYKRLGIKICNRWKDVRNFIQDVGDRKKGYVLTRKDFYSDFTPDNCIWVNRGAHITMHNEFLIQENSPIIAIPVDVIPTKEAHEGDKDLMVRINIAIEKKTKERSELSAKINKIDEEVRGYEDLVIEMEKMWGVINQKLTY